MAELPPLTLPTVAAIDAHYERHQDVKRAQRLNARLLASNCEREGWYAFRWAAEPKRFKGDVVRANSARQANVDNLTESLSAIGLKIERVDPKTYEAIKVEALDGHYVQKMQGKVTGVLEAPKTPHILYVDQQSAKAFGQIVKHGLAAAVPWRIPALQLGMHLLGLTRAFYLVRNKDTEQLHSQRLEYDAPHAMALLAKGERIRDANDAPPRVNDDPNWFECKYCPAFDLCHAGGSAPRNCRTCLHSSPVAGGAWHCTRHDKALTLLEQEAGCPNHLYLPSLVAGEATDADENTETVTYAMRDGSQWVDGAQRVTA